MSDFLDMNNEPKVELDQFIGIFSNAIDDKLCAAFLDWFNKISEQGLTLSSMEESGSRGSSRKDEVIHIPCMMLPHSVFPGTITTTLWQNIKNCHSVYYSKYDLDREMTSYGFKMHRVLPTEGYHQWHHEHWFIESNRILAWHLTLEAPEEGGETEFMFQSKRIEPIPKQLLIFPAAFTHKHRGNPPLKGQKTYITGWFELIPPAPKNVNRK